MLLEITKGVIEMTEQMRLTPQEIIDAIEKMPEIYQVMISGYVAGINNAIAVALNQ